MPHSPSLRTLLLPVAAGLALALGACGGSGVDDAKVKSIQDKATKITEQGANLQDQAAKLAADVKAGRITQAEADAQLKAKTDDVLKQAKSVENDTIDAVKADDRLPDEAKKALQDAQDQISTTP